MSSVWRAPPEESIDFYPGLVVSDNRVTGSITCGRSRLPLWAFAGVAVIHGWAEAESGWTPSKYGWTAETMAVFLFDLLEQRGEFGRLLLILADVERRERNREDDALAGHGPVVKVFPETDPDAVAMPPPWWEQAEDRERVVAQLRRCIDVLESSE